LQQVCRRKAGGARAGVCGSVGEAGGRAGRWWQCVWCVVCRWVGNQIHAFFVPEVTIHH